jgi:hypothetical protein
MYVYSSSGRTYGSATRTRTRPARTTGSGDGKEENIFYCKNKVQISSDYVCDLIDDCGDASDERSPSPCQGRCTDGEQHALTACTVLFWLWFVACFWETFSGCEGSMLLFRYDASPRFPAVLWTSTGVWVLLIAISCSAMLSVCNTPGTSVPGNHGATQEINFNIVTVTFASIAWLACILLLPTTDLTPDRKYTLGTWRRRYFPYRVSARFLVWKNFALWTIVLTGFIVFSVVPSPFEVTQPVIAVRERPSGLRWSDSGSLDTMGSTLVKTSAAECLKTVDQMVQPDSDPVRWFPFGAKSCAWRAPPNATSGWVQVDLLGPKRIVMLTLGTAGPGVENMKIQGSNGSTGPFAALAMGQLSGDPGPWGGTGTLQDVYIPSVTPYRYVRVQVSHPNATSIVNGTSTATLPATTNASDTPCANPGCVTTVPWDKCVASQRCDLCSADSDSILVDGVRSRTCPELGWGVHLLSVDIFTGVGYAKDAEL